MGDNLYLNTQARVPADASSISSGHRQAGSYFNLIDIWLSPGCQFKFKYRKSEATMAAADSIAAVLMHASNDNQLFAAPTPTAATRTLYIPELLHPIFSFLSRKCNVSNACVCKLWSEIALDVIWSEVDGLVPLFTALKPIVTSRIDYVSICYRVTR